MAFVVDEGDFSDARSLPLLALSYLSEGSPALVVQYSSLIISELSLP
jgi:hypothetical protein